MTIKISKSGSKSQNTRRLMKLARGARNRIEHIIYQKEET